MKSIHGVIGFFCTLTALSFSADSSSGDDGYVNVDANGNQILPMPRVRKRQMPTRAPKPTLDPNAPINPNPIPRVREMKVKPTDDEREAKRKQREEDNKMKADIAARLKQLNNLRIANKQPTMASEKCVNGVCKFIFKDNGEKKTCTGNVESFLMDESPGFQCSGATCFLNASTGVMDCGAVGEPVGTPFAPVPTGIPIVTPVNQPPNVPPGCRLVNGVVNCHPPDEPPCEINHERGIHSCPAGGPRRVEEAI